jgi:pimeloyl-ACP methyl ester carboxylesterase
MFLIKKRSITILTKRLLAVAGVFAVAYLGISLALRFWQTRLIFFPSALIKSMPANVGLSYQTVWIAIAHDRIHGWWIPAKTANPPVILFFHGNGSNIGDGVGRAARFHQLGWSVLLFDYRGYGNSTGEFPNETSVDRDAEAVWNYLTRTRQIAPKTIFLYGHSLGGAIAIALAVRHPNVGGVMVESTFTSVRAMIDHTSWRLFPADWILTQRFDSLSKVRNSLRVPILFIHGTADTTIPAQMSLDLFRAAPEPKQLLMVPQANHGNSATLGGQEYLQVIQDFVHQYAPKVTQTSTH